MTKQKQTKERQYEALFEAEIEHKRTELGLMSNHTWANDPKRLLFLLARYKFVARMLEGCDQVLEVGCADAFGTRVVQQMVGDVYAIDFDPVFIEDVKSRLDPRWPLGCSTHDMLSGPIKPENFDAAFALDVLEHIQPRDEEAFIVNMSKSIKQHGSLILGMPSIESQKYASTQSKEGHVNCKSGEGFRKTMAKYFHNVFMFSINDEVVHTGYFPMAHYLVAICTSKKM